MGQTDLKPTAQKDVVNAANTTKSPGQGWCAAWVTNVFQSAGIGYFGGNACDMCRAYCTSTNVRDLKVGMIIADVSHPGTGEAGRLSILSLVMLIQLIKISQRIDGTATLPAIKDIVFLIIYATIFIWLLKNSLKICAGAYDLFNEMIGKINQSTVDELKTVTIADSCKESFGAVIGIWVQSMIFDLITIIIKGSVSVMCYMRAMQLYVMAAFSPLPFALLGFDETKNYGVSFCKNFLATCLAGVIILFAMGLFPNLLSGFSGGEISGFKGDMWSSVCASVALMLIVIKSGTIARDVFGG